MPCAHCDDPVKETEEYGTVVSSDNPFPLKATDIQVVDGEDIVGFHPRYWDNERNKLLIIVPAAFTPVCYSELNKLGEWMPKFDAVGCDVIAVCQDSALMLVDWFLKENIDNSGFTTFSSYLIPERLGLMRNGRSKRASVFITDKEVIVQHHPMNHMRDFNHLLDMAKA